MTWTWFDFAVIGVVGLSGLFAMARGFVKELISLAGWIVAAIVTFLVVVSGIVVAGVGSAVWGLLAGGLVMGWLGWHRKGAGRVSR